MKIIRYSFKGFEPQYQDFHLKSVDSELNNFNIADYPAHLRKFIMQRHEKLVPFYRENYNDFRYGVWGFIDGFKNNQSLNHLKQRVPLWVANISDDIVVYDVNWERKMKITDEECKYFGLYIPENQLKSLQLVH